MKTNHVGVPLNKNKRLILLSIFTILIFTTQNSFVTVQADGRFPFNADGPGFVYQVINNEYITREYNLPAVDIVSLNRDSVNSLLKLELYGQPNISSSNQYWILLAWDEYGQLYDVGNWSDPSWEKYVPNNINLTVCVAGGASWFGITNGSYSVLYNSKGTMVFSEVWNNSVSIVNNNILTFPFTAAPLLENPNFVNNELVYTMFNATVNATKSVYYLDSMPTDFLDHVFGLGAVLNTDPASVTLNPCFFIWVIVSIRKRRRRRK